MGLDLNRADFYEKELSFQVSCSYGPGRYDTEYEENGHDYPFGFVRWTEQRNFEAVLQLMAEGKLDVKPLMTHWVAQEKAEQAYRLLTEDPTALGILLIYSDSPVKLERTLKGHDGEIERTPSSATACAVGVIGAGNFTTAVILPALKKTAAIRQAIASTGGTSAAIAARKFSISEVTSEYKQILEHDLINTVLITTRHNTHARLVIEALQAGKHVFVEKPLALNREELSEIGRTLENAAGLHLMVGFNRRFAPLAVRMRKLLEQRTQPLSVVYTVNAGAIPADHWTQDKSIGGGRIIGEGCHFIDFLRYLVGDRIIGVEARMIGRTPGIDVREDKMTILLEFSDGSSGTVHYLANGNKRYPKERVEVFVEERVLVLDNFRSLQGYGWPGIKRERLWRQDKGHQAEIEAFVDRVVEGGKPLIPWEELEEVTLATFVAVEQAQELARGLC